jgi:hypothetical protein
MRETELEDYLKMWDALDDATAVYIATSFASQDRTRAIFIETPDLKDLDYVISRVFLSKDDAEIYRKLHSKTPMSFAKIQLGKLYKSLEVYFSKNTSSKYFECVLSSIDDSGKCVELDIIWTNQFNS